MKRGRILTQGSKLVVLSFYTVFCLFPIFWLILTSFKTDVDIYSRIPIFFFNPTLQHYKTVFSSASSTHLYLLNSIVVSVSTAIASVLLGSLAGYGLARFRFRHSDDLAFWIITLRMFPPILVSIPLYLLFSSMGQLDTYQVLVIAYLTFNLPLSIWLMRSFFLNLPIDIEEAAMIDGCSYFSTFIRIALPLVKNGIFATGILTFMFSWNEFLFALILTSSVKAQTLPINIAGYVSFHKLNFGAMAAISIVALIPIFAIFYYIQKYIVTGMTMGAVKG